MNIGYIDTAGNCLFQYHSLYINISGNKNKEVPKRALKSIFERSSIVSSKILREMIEAYQCLSPEKKRMLKVYMDMLLQYGGEL
mgnify:CR=1 FL=1